MKPNILFITIDALRADKTYGENKSSLTPNLDSLISNGVLFKQTISGADQTGSSLASIFTSKFPITSGINQFNFSSETEIILSIFKKNGYHVETVIPEHDFFRQLSKNFDESYLYPENGKSKWNKIGEGVGQKIIDRISSIENKQPWFFYIHVMDIRHPFDVSEEFDDEKFGETNYDKIVSSIDIWLGKIVNQIDLSDTLVVVSADHGENIPVTGEYMGESSKTQRAIRKTTKSVPFLEKFGLKAVMNLRYASQTYKKEILKYKLTPLEMRSFNTRGANTLYDETIRVPLIFSGYSMPSKKIISELVRQVDIFPTLLEISGLETTSNNDGRSLLSIINGEKVEEIPAYIETGINLSSLLDKKAEILGKSIGIRTSSYKYWRARNDSKEDVFLFNLKDDPNEENNISGNNNEIIEQMESKLEKLKGRSVSGTKLSHDEIQKAKDLLLKLGYIDDKN